MELLQSVCKFQWGLWHALDEQEQLLVQTEEKKKDFFFISFSETSLWKPRVKSLFLMHTGLKAPRMNWGPPKYILSQLKKKKEHCDREGFSGEDSNREWERNSDGESEE